MRVILNVETPFRDCGCASLLEHWEAATHHKADRCSVAHCTAPANDAAVVTVMDEEGTRKHVAPVCHWHAAQKAFDTDVSQESRLVPHSIQDTCHASARVKAAI